MASEILEKAAGKEVRASLNAVSRLVGRGLVRTGGADSGGMAPGELNFATYGCRFDSNKTLT